MMRFYLLTALFAAFFSVACSSRPGGTEDLFPVESYTPRYASGFDIRSREGSASRLVTIRNPWQGARDAVMRLLILRDGELPPEGFEGAVVHAPVRRVVCMSSSHIAMFDALGCVEKVKGVSGMGYISNKYILAHRDSIADVGYDANIDFERLRSLRPDIVLLYAVSGDNTVVSGKLREMAIPYIYIGDYVEQSPLGKAEWMHVVAEMTDRHELCATRFDSLTARYETLRSSVAEEQDTKPVRVMFNTPYRDTWFMPSKESYMVRLVEDAGGEYVYPENRGSASVPVDIEQAYMLARGADVWLNVEGCNTLAELKAENPRFADMPAVKERRVWSCNRRQTPSGGSDFWESGVVNPDRALMDMVAIIRGTEADTCHYYKRLE